MKKYHIITIGCQMNKADSERIAGFLELQGMKEVSDRKRADLVIIVTCGVRQSAEDRIFGLVPRIKKDNPKTKMLFTGCLVYRDDIKKRLGGLVDYWMPVYEIFNFKILNPKQIPNPKSKIQNYLQILPTYSSKFTAFVPIGNGCDNFCAYCVVPYARGREVYRPAEEIIDEVKGLVKKGHKEIFLIAQNVNSYSSIIQNSKFKIQNYSITSRYINFAQLLKIINSIPGNFWIRFATSHPKDMSDELIKAIAECEKVCEHVHLPAQAGDDSVLKRMNRKYTIGHYKILIDKIRKETRYKQQDTNKLQNSKTKIFKLPVAITTDIIVGFPGETKKKFFNTVKLFREVKFDMAYIARYSPRPGTVAAKMKDDVSREEKKRREEELMKILRKTALENNKYYLGKTVAVLISGKDRKGQYFGYTRTFKNTKVIIRSKKHLIGKFVDVKITQAQDFGLEGEII